VQLAIKRNRFVAFRDEMAFQEAIPSTAKDCAE
jgi:hypothetical protein